MTHDLSDPSYCGGGLISAHRRLFSALFSLFALALMPYSLVAGDKPFNPDHTYFAADIDPHLFGPGDTTANIQTVRFVCPTPDGFQVVYSNERAEFYFDDHIVVGVDFLPRRLVPAVGGHFKKARVDLAAHAASEAYVNDMLDVVDFTGKAKPVGIPNIIQNTPRSIIVRTEVAPMDEDLANPTPERHMDILHGYFTFGSSLFEFHAVAARGDGGAPVGTAMFAAWLGRVLQRDK